MTDRIDFGSEPWQAIPRQTLRDARLSTRAKGGLVTLLSHEEGWVRSAIAVLMKENEGCGRAQARSILKELVDLGYARMDQKRGAGGKFTTAYTISASSGLSTRRSPGAVKRGAVQRGAVNRSAVVDPQEGEPQEGEPKASTLAPRPRDESFEVLCEVGELSNFADISDDIRGSVNKALERIRSATPPQLRGNLPGEIRRRAALWETHFDATISAAALAKHWSRLSRPGPRGSARTRAPSAAEQRIARIGIGPKALEEGNG